MLQEVAETASFTKDSLLVTDDEIFSIRPYIPYDKYYNGIAYLNENYYYLFRGEYKPDELREKLNKPYVLPGIYVDSSTKQSFAIDPVTDEDKEKFTYDGKINSYDPQKLIDAVNKKEIIITPISESGKKFMPEILKTDDILKRALKQAIIAKDIDLESLKDRFGGDKNQLFNFRQSLFNKDSKISILLFDRGTESMNLKYTITLEEKDPSVSVGNHLKDPIVISSDDTYDI